MLHLDDLAEIEQQGKKLHILLAMKKTNPTSHYLMLVARKDKLAKNRDAIVRTVAGLIEAARFMQDPKNADAVADAAAVTGHSKEVTKAALKEFLAIDFWAAKDDGLPRNKLEATAKLMKKIGAIKPDKEPVTYDKSRRCERLEGRQRDGEMKLDAPYVRLPRAVLAEPRRRHRAWEIAGRLTSAAFMVPFSETLVRLWQLVRERRIHPPVLSIRRSCSSPASCWRSSSACRSACCWRACARCASASSPT